MAALVDLACQEKIDAIYSRRNRLLAFSEKVEIIKRSIEELLPKPRKS